MSDPTIAESHKDYSPKSNSNNIVDTVKIVAKDQQNSHLQRSLRIMAATQIKVEATKQVQFPTNLCAVICMKKISQTFSKPVTLIQIYLLVC